METTPASDDHDLGADDDGTTVRATAEVVSGTRWGVLSQVALQFTRLGTQIVLARLLAPSDFGVVTLGFTFMLVLDLLKDLGTVTALIQRPTVNDRLVSTLFFVNVGFGLLFTVSFACVAPLLARSVDDSRATAVFQVLGLTLAVSSFGLVHQAMIRRARRFRRMAAITVGNAVCSAAVSVALAFAGASVWALALGQVAGSVAGLVLSWRGSGVRIRRTFSWEDLRNVRGFGLSVTAFNFFNFMFLNADKLIVGTVLGATALGLYGLGQRVLFYPVRSVTQMIQQVLFPTFARVDDDVIGRGYLRACGGIALVTFPLMAGITVVAGPLVRVVFGDEWQDAVFVITVLAPVGLLHSLHFTVGSLYNSKGKGRELLLWGIGSGGVTLIAYFAGLPWGINGLAVSYAIAVVALTYPTFAIPFRFIGLRFIDLWRAIRTITAYTLVMSATSLAARLALQAADSTDVVVLAASVLTGAATYVALLAFRRPAAVSDLARLVRRR